MDTKNKIQFTRFDLGAISIIAIVAIYYLLSQVLSGNVFMVAFFCASVFVLQFSRRLSKYISE